MNSRCVGPTLAATVLIFAAAAPVRAQEKPAAIYGQQLMTQEEQEQYRTRLREAQTEEERAVLREQHRQEMQARARERGVELPAAAASPPVRGRELMTQEEREQHRQEMRTRTTAEEREKARREKHEEMKERAREQGVGLPDEPMPRRGGGPGSGAGGGPGGGAGGPRPGGHPQ